MKTGAPAGDAFSADPSPRAVVARVYSSPVSDFASSSGNGFGELGGIRTLDPMIKSHVLYRLSYELSPPPRRLSAEAGQPQPGAMLPRRTKNWVDRAGPRRATHALRVTTPRHS